MFENLSVAWKVVIAPVWLAWRAYQGLWWAFDDFNDARPAADPSPTQAPGAPALNGAPPALQSAPRPKPVKELKLGFVASTILWFPAAYLAAWLHNMGWVSQTGAVFGTLWTAGALWILSLIAVRRHVRTTPVKRTPLQAARAAIQTVKDSPRTIAAKAAGAARGLTAVPVLAKGFLHRAKAAAAGMVPAKFRAPATGGANGQAPRF